ncbi:MAG: GAF domain-containing sensor histidine kinase [Anaerolineales bacterium]|nr:GAF domain-containing sensor histidine kinase [Anaerolineales bacterium]
MSAEADELQRRNRELSILNAIAEALNQEVDLTRSLQTALGKVAELLNLRTGWIWLLREDSGEAYLAATLNLPPALANAPHRMEGTCYCLDTYRAGDLAGAANVNVVTCSRLRWLLTGTEGLRSHASIPLYAHGKPLGVLNVASPGWRELAPGELRLLYTVGDLVSIAVERARLFERQAEFGAAEERNRLAREIHDTLAQGLTAITLQLETAEALLDSQARERARQAVAQALALARANLEEARRSVLDLRAAPLEGRTLAQALAALAEEAGKKDHVAVAYAATGASQPLPLRLEAGLYRIAQEALTNAVRHAQARHIRLALVTQPSEVQLTVEDDGRGFDAGQIPKDRYGLIGLNERTHLLGGRLDLQSSPGEGTRVVVTVRLG